MADPANEANPLARPLKPSRHLRIGVSGHRLQSGRNFDIAAVNRAMQVVFNDAEMWLSKVKAPVFNATPPVITLISALADGPDQMAVTNFLERPDPTGMKRRIEAVIPFPLEDYASTFERSDDEARMRAQMEQADSVLTLADWAPPEDIDSHIFAAHFRDQRYATVGDLIVRQSDVLVAVWDGMPGAGPGGTADVVAQAVAERMAVVSIHPETGAISLITKYRFSDLDATWEAAEGDAIPNDLFLSFDTLAKTYKVERLDRILSDELLPPERMDDKRPDSLMSFLKKEPVKPKTKVTLYHYLFSSPGKKFTKRQTKGEGAETPKKTKLFSISIPANHVENSLNSVSWKDLSRLCESDKLFVHFAEAWSRTDAIATRLGHHYRSTYVFIFCMAALATFAGLLGLPLVYLGLNEIYFVSAECIILCLGLMIYWRGRRAHQHRRWLNAREISEQMRAHWPLGLIGLGGRRLVTRNKSWTAWLFNAYASPVGIPNLNANTEVLIEIARTIQSEIVKDQAGYHLKNEKVLDFNHKKLETIGNLALVMAFISSLSSIAYLINEHYHHYKNAFFHACLVAASAALPGIGAAATGIRFQGDFERFARRSEQTAAALHLIDQQLDQFISAAEAGGTEKPRFENLRDIVTRLEQVLLSDLDDWRFVYEARPDPGVG